MANTSISGMSKPPSKKKYLLSKYTYSDGVETGTPSMVSGTTGELEAHYDRWEAIHGLPLEVTPAVEMVSDLQRKEINHHRIEELPLTRPTFMGELDRKDQLLVKALGQIKYWREKYESLKEEKEDGNTDVDIDGGTDRFVYSYGATSEDYEYSPLEQGRRSLFE